MADRLLTQSNSKLAKADLAKLLSDEEAWSGLSEETQRHLYSLLPVPESEDNAPHDHTIHPFRTQYGAHIKHSLHAWQNDLAEGRNTKTWEREAKQASGERAAGAFDGIKDSQREEWWGQKYDPKADAAELKSSIGGVDALVKDGPTMAEEGGEMVAHEEAHLPEDANDTTEDPAIVETDGAEQDEGSVVGGESWAGSGTPERVSRWIEETAAGLQ